jgi:hypothetical protein
VRNRNVVAGAVRDADPDFLRALELLRDTQVAGVVGLRVEEDKTKGSTAVLFFQREAVPEEILQKSAEIRRLLKLAPGQQRFVITYSPVPGADNELAVNSRSMLQIMMAFSSYVDVPPEDLKQNLALPALEIAPSAAGFDQVHIHSGQNRPAGTYAAIYYHDHWFWIDQDDWRTKRALLAMMFFFTLSDTGAPERLPLVTIPAQ